MHPLLPTQCYCTINWTSVNWEELLEADQAHDYSNGNDVVQSSPDISDPVNYVVVSTDRSTNNNQSDIDNDVEI